MLRSEEFWRSLAVLWTSLAYETRKGVCVGGASCMTSPRTRQGRDKYLAGAAASRWLECTRQHSPSLAVTEGMEQQTSIR